MNTLTKNRILQKGDEYRNNGEWKSVPKENFGLQIQFTDYKEVRRPSEQPFQQGSETVTRHAHNVETAGSTPAPAKPISPDSGKSVKAAPVAKAESDTKSPASSHSGAGDASYLPTVVSKKAHSQKHTQQSDREIIDSIPYDQPMTDEEQAALDREIARQPKLVPVDEAAKAGLEFLKKLAESEAPTFDPTGAAPFPKGPIEKAAEKVAAIGAAYNAKNGLIKITYPKPDPTNLIEMSEQPIWTGRNGTFTGYGLEAMRVNNNVMLSPIGKRGVGNCAIQMPLASIDELINWLKKQTPK
jgi:hypothetical protein